MQMASTQVCISGRMDIFKFLEIWQTNSYISNLFQTYYIMSDLREFICNRQPRHACSDDFNVPNLRRLHLFILVRLRVLGFVFFRVGVTKASFNYVGHAFLVQVILLERFFGRYALVKGQQVSRFATACITNANILANNTNIKFVC